MEEYSELINRIVREYAYAAIFVGLLLENTLLLGVLVPGVTVLVIAGFISALGDLNFFLCLIAGIGGTVIGDNLSYLFGRYGAGRFRFVERIIDRNAGIIARVRSMNIYVLLFFHFPGYLRLALPVALGVVRFDFRKWLAIDLAGSVLFNLAFIGLGYLIALTTGLFADASAVASSLQYIFAGFFLIWLVTLFYGYMNFRKFRRSKTDGIAKSLA